MEIPMDVVIGSGEDDFKDLDFYYGSKTLQGTSEVVSLAAQTIINRHLVKQVPSIEGIRAAFRKSFESSYGQRFSLQITGVEQVRVMNYLGEDGFFEIFNHYLGLAVGKDVPILKKVALGWHNNYVKDDVELVERLINPLKRLHKSIENQGYSVTLRKRSRPIALFDSQTLAYISHETVEKETIFIEASIGRFNRLTGTGRLLTDIDAKTISFSPARSWKLFPIKQRKALSRNLDGNNGVEDFIPLHLEVSRVLSVDGVVKHYRLHQVLI